MRRFIALLFLIAIALVVVYAGRRLKQNDDLHVTVLFRPGAGILAGAPVVSGSETIGRVRSVQRIESVDAASLAIDGRFSSHIRTDSMFTVEGKAPSARVEVVDVLAIGPVVEDGAVLTASEGRLAELLARGGATVTPFLRDLAARGRELLRDYDTGEFERQLAEWKSDWPEWQQQGQAVAERNIEAIREEVDELERSLREQKRFQEAARLREQFDRWLSEWKAKRRADESTR